MSDLKLPTSFDKMIDFLYEVQNMADATAKAEVLWPALNRVLAQEASWKSACESLMTVFGLPVATSPDGVSAELNKLARSASSVDNRIASDEPLVLQCIHCESQNDLQVICSDCAAHAEGQQTSITIRHLQDALDSPTVQELSNIFKFPTIGKSLCQQIVDVLAPRLCQSPAASGREVYNAFLSFVSQTVECDACKGRGYTQSAAGPDDCACGGSGEMPKFDEISAMDEALKAVGFHSQPETADTLTTTLAPQFVHYRDAVAMAEFILSKFDVRRKSSIPSTECRHD